VFDKVPEELLVLQDLNMYLMSEIPKGKLVRLEYPKPGLKTNLKFVKFGSMTELTKIVHELIFLLRIKDDIDYENSIYKGFSPVVNWLFKIVNQMKGDATQKVVHVVLTPKDHEFLVKNLKTEGDTLCYRAFQQTLNLLVLLASLPYAGPIAKRLGDLLANKVSGFVIRRNLNDKSEVEPYYVWMSVLDPEERGLVIKRVGENFFSEQNRLLRSYRSSNPGTSSLELEKLKKKVDERLSVSIKATIYGRLAIYREIKKSNPEVIDTLSSRKGTKQLTDVELRRYAGYRKATSLFAPENIVASVYDLINKPIEIMDLTRNALLDPSSSRVFYYTQDVESCVTFKDLAGKVAAGNANTGEAALFNSIKSRCVQFVPGISKR
jgi:hypothetical protein